MDFLQRTPFFRLLLPFLLGILAYPALGFSISAMLSLMLLSLFLLGFSFLLKEARQQYKFRWLFGSGIFLFLFVLAYFRTDQGEQAHPFDHLRQKGVFRVELTASPIEKAKSILCKVEVLQLYADRNWIPSRGKANLYLQKSAAASRLQYGDRVMIATEFIPPEKVQNPDGFDYAAYLKRQGVGATAYIPATRWRWLNRNNDFSIQRAADQCRSHLLGVYKKFNIQGDEFAVLAALTLGYTDALQPDIRASYSATGAMHILSVSGMHVGVVYVVLLFLLSFMDSTTRGKLVKMLLIVFFLWGYAFLTGLSPAVIRAALMFSFIAMAFYFERKSLLYNTIFMSAFLMLLYNPAFLYDVGFQLSYAAVLSIIFFQAIFNKFYTPKTKIARFFWTMFAVSMAAQLGTTPFTLYYFQQFPNYFLLTNFVAIDLSSLIIYLAMGLLTLSFVPYLSTGLAFLLKWSLSLLNFLIIWIQNLPGSTAHISLDFWQTILLFSAIFSLSTYYFTRRYAALFLGLFAALLVAVFNLQANYSTLTSSRLLVFSDQKNSHLNFIDRKKNYVFTTDSTAVERVAKTFWKRQKLDDPIFIKMEDGALDEFFCFKGLKIMVLTSDLLKNKTSATPLLLDYLIVGNHQKPNIEHLLTCVQPLKIIVDKSISKWYTESIKQACIQHGIEFYAVAEQGAYNFCLKEN